MERHFAFLAKFLSDFRVQRVHTGELNMPDHEHLLREYVERGSESAFRELVTRYIDLVYSVAFRQVGADAQLAQDVVQTVFTDLARQAPKLISGVRLGGWLHRDTCFVAAKLVRTERRRQVRERRAVEMNMLHSLPDSTWEQIAPVLDEAIDLLSAADREAIVLRFFERRDLRTVGAALGLSEDASQKRVSRALEKLRRFLVRRGVTLSAGALGSTLAGQALISAPAGMAASVAGTALAGATASAGGTLSLIKLMAMTKLKAGALSALLVAAVATPLAVQHQSLKSVRLENAALLEANQELPQLREENQRFAKLKVDAEELQRLRAEHAELLRLRGEAGRLRQSQADAARLEAENARRPAQANQKEDTEPNEQADEQQEIFKTIARARMSYVKVWGLAFVRFAEKHGGMMAETFEEAAKFCPEEWAPMMSAFDQNKFEIVFRGSLDDIIGDIIGRDTIVVREKVPFVNRSKTGYARTYLFADGHAEIHASPDGNFESWENEHLATPPPP